jgi:hypothetical protein
VQPRHARARKMLQIQTNLRMWRFPDCLMFKFYNQFIYVSFRFEFCQIECHQFIKHVD